MPQTPHRQLCHSVSTLRHPCTLEQVRVRVPAQMVAFSEHLHLDFSPSSISEKCFHQPVARRRLVSPCINTSFLFYSPSNSGFCPEKLNVQREVTVRHSCAHCSWEEKALSSASLFLAISLFCLSVSHSYESSAEILPHTPRLTHFPTISGSPASLADSMQQKLAGPHRRRPQNPSAM